MLISWEHEGTPWDYGGAPWQIRIDNSVWTFGGRTRASGHFEVMCFNITSNISHPRNGWRLWKESRRLAHSFQALVVKMGVFPIYFRAGWAQKVPIPPSAMALHGQAANTRGAALNLCLKMGHQPPAVLIRNMINYPETCRIVHCKCKSSLLAESPT